MSAHSRLDVSQIRQGLRDRIEDLLFDLFPKGKREGHVFYVGDISGSPGRSLAIELAGERCGLWKDFATDEGGDLFDLWAARHGLDASRHFPQVLEQTANWLGIAHPDNSHAEVTLEEPKSNIQYWNYLDLHGQLIARVYRQDTSKGKDYRPWDASRNCFGMPTPRPLYRLPQLDKADTVILVEGEKCADALYSLGYAATTAMAGASAPFDKTDWSPLKGKTVIVWPDHDTPGQKYAATLQEKLPSVGLRELLVINPPQDKPAKWDAADAVLDGTDVATLIGSASPVSPAEKASRLVVDWHAVDRFQGQPRERQWLIEEIFPQAQASLLAASGGVGKSYLLLSLAREVANHDGSWLNAPRVFGGALTSSGAALYITAEDDAIELHNRLNALGQIPPRLFVMPLPDAGGAQAFFAPDPLTKAPSTTGAWLELVSQFDGLSDLKLVVLDPLQPLCALDLNVPENAQFVCSRLASLASQTGAAVIVSHHFAKREAYTPEQAREAIRGTGGLVDGVRSVYALWHAKDDEAKSILKKLGLPYQRSSVVHGGVVKANGKANLNVITYVRDTRGLLCDRSDDLFRLKAPAFDLLQLLRDAIANAAAEGKPYTKSGINGVYERRFEMDGPLQDVGKHRLVGMVDDLLASGKVVQAMADNSKSVKWLDVPTGDLALGNPNFTAGFLQRNSKSFKGSVNAKPPGVPSFEGGTRYGEHRE